MLGIAETFKKFSKKSILAGVVMRRDLIIDGMAYATATIGGDDATQSIISMHAMLAREDINCILIDGLEDIIKGHFGNWEDKIAKYQKLGSREKVTLKTGKNLFIRCWSVNQRRALAVLNSFTRQGSIPEPIRVAKIAARSHANALNYELEKN